MIGELPEALEVCGRAYQIRADFRNCLRIFEALSDPALNDWERAFILLMRLYRDPPADCAEEALRQAGWFLDGGDMPHSEPEPVRMIDWKHDESMLIPAVSKAAGIPDIRTLPFLHWWTFLGLFCEIGEGLFSAVMQIRRKRAHGQKLDRAEQDFLRKNADVVLLRTAEEQAAIDRTKAFLDSIT